MSVRSVSVVFQAFTDNFEKKTEKASMSLGSFAKKAIAIGGTFLLAKAGVDKFTQQFEKLDRFAKLSDALQVSPEFIRGLDFAATQTGESFERISDAVKEFNLRMGEAKRGTGPAIEGLDILGLKVEQFANMKPEEAFIKVTDAISKIEDPQLKIFAAGELFGGAGEELLNFINQGEEGIRKFIEASNELGGPIDREELRRIEEANQAIDRMGRAWEGIIQQLAIAFAPAMEMVAGAMTEMNKLTRKFVDMWRDAETALTDFLLKANNATFGQLGLGVTDEQLANIKETERELSGLLSAKGGVGAISSNIEKSRFNLNTQKALGNTETAVASLSAGSASAFRAINQRVSGDTDKSILAESKKTNQTLSSIDEKIGSNRSNFKQVNI